MVPWLLWWMQPWALAAEASYSDRNAWGRVITTEQGTCQASAGEGRVTRSTAEGSGRPQRETVLRLCCQTPTLFDGFPKFHRRHWQRFNSSCSVWSQKRQPYWSDPIDSQCQWECACCPRLCSFFFMCSCVCVLMCARATLIIWHQVIREAILAVTIVL